MDIEKRNHPGNKDVLKFTEEELDACRLMSHDEAKAFLGKAAFQSDLAAFHPGFMLTQPESISVRASGQLDPRHAIADALKDRDHVTELLAKYDAGISFGTENI